MRLVHRKLALEAQHRGGDEGAAGQHAGVGDEEAGGEVVGAVADDVVAGDQRQGVVGGEAGFVRLDGDAGVDGAGLFRRRRDLGAAEIGGAVGDLALQVGQLDPVVVDEADMADAGGGEIEQEWAAEAAGADHQHPRRAQLRLADAADLAEQDVPGVAVDLMLVEIEVHGPTYRACARRLGRGAALRAQKSDICVSAMPAADGAGAAKRDESSVSRPARPHCRAARAKRRAKRSA